MHPSMDLLLDPNSYYACPSCPNCIEEFYNDRLFDISIMNRKYLSLYDGKMIHNIEELKEEICAFANSGGGNILIGINPHDYRVKGIRFSEETFNTFKEDIEKIKIFP